MEASSTVLEVLEQTSRTFSIPIRRLPSGLQEAIISAYLCMRALDEIEDHPSLSGSDKITLLRSISQTLQQQTEASHLAEDPFMHIFKTLHQQLPEVTLRLAEWAAYAPAAIAPRIWDATAAMAERMAQWVANEWRIHNRADLDGYTFAVAGTVGVLLCDLWAWFDGLQMHRSHAIQFGRGLQAVNMLRNRAEDIARGIDFYPTGWTDAQMHEYARWNLSQAENYANTLPPGPFASFIQLPLTFAYATLDALAHGEKKLSRGEVLRLVQSIDENYS